MKVQGGGGFLLNSLNPPTYASGPLVCQLVKSPVHASEKHQLFHFVQLPGASQSSGGGCGHVRSGHLSDACHRPLQGRACSRRNKVGTFTSWLMGFHPTFPHVFLPPSPTTYWILLSSYTVFSSRMMLSFLIVVLKFVVWMSCFSCDVSISVINDIHVLEQALGGSPMF